MNHFLIVAAGGAIGASLRHGAGLLSLRLLPQHWPWATFSVNILGCLIMGFVVGWFALKSEAGGQTLRLFLTTGLLGGFTTFSAFSLETMNMLRSGETLKGVAYASLSVVLSVAALGLGLYLTRKLFA